MTATLFSERVNAISNMISNITADPAERYGLAMAIAEIYRHELNGYLIVVTPSGEGQKNVNTNAPAGGNS